MGKSAAQKTKGANINSKLGLVIRSGKYNLGAKSTLRTLRSGKGAFPWRATLHDHLSRSRDPSRAPLRAPRSSIARPLPTRRLLTLSLHPPSPLHFPYVQPSLF
jgi:hypothetical protein